MENFLTYLSANAIWDVFGQNKQYWDKKRQIGVNVYLLFITMYIIPLGGNYKRGKVLLELGQNNFILLTNDHTLSGVKVLNCVNNMMYNMVFSPDVRMNSYRTNNMLKPQSEKRKN